jgi:hypothetical protein
LVLVILGAIGFAVPAGSAFHLYRLSSSENLRGELDQLVPTDGEPSDQDRILLAITKKNQKSDGEMIWGIRLGGPGKA